MAMKIALFHNYYKLPGGEDTVFELEIEALRAYGHTVIPYTAHNSEAFAENSLSQKIRGALDAPHNRTRQAAIGKFLAQHRPDISHVHNWFPILSPSIYTAHDHAGIPVVQTLHNYRLGCAAATYYRNGTYCDACRPGKNLPALRHRCYNNSTAGSFVWKRIMDRGWKHATFSKRVCHYISPSAGVRRKHIEMGLPSDKITHIPNACPDPRNIPELDTQRLNPHQQHICFVGRLVPEKGVHILIRAWQQTSAAFRAKRRLTIIGGGPQEATLHELARGDQSIHFTGQLSLHETLTTLKQADLLVCPSIWAEPFGLSVIEAMAAGIPVVSSKLGGPAEIIEDGVDGYLFPAGDIAALRDTLSHCFQAPEELKARGRAARLKYMRCYTPHRHAQNLTRCFQQVLSSRQTQSAPRGTTN
jgi:glycosyltransferase involved in cell wall biosynthesis